MQIDVVSEGKSGLLGIRSEPAVVRVTLPDADDEPTADDDAEMDDEPTADDDAEMDDEPTADDDAEMDDEPQPDALSDFLPFADEFDDYDDDDDADDLEEEEEIHEVVRVGYDVLSTLLGKMGVSADVYLRDPYDGDSEGPVFEIEGEDSGLLIGARGDTLRALQFIVSFLVSRRLGERTNLMVDVEGYQQRRYDSVANLARRVAQRVAQSGRAIPLEPMPPNERRQVHMALADHAAVVTESEGYGDNRKVVVQPK